MELCRVELLGTYTVTVRLTLLSYSEPVAPRGYWERKEYGIYGGPMSLLRSGYAWGNVREQLDLKGIVLTGAESEILVI